MCLIIQKEGILTTLQGLGSYGLQRFGINPRGAMDRTAVRLINLLLGNAEDDNTLEMHFPAAEIRFEDHCLFALGGADLGAELDSQPLDNWRVCSARPSSTLRFGRRSSGSRCYLAIAGGLTTNPATETTYETVRLTKGIRLMRIHPPGTVAPVDTVLSPDLFPNYQADPELRVVPSAEFEDLQPKSLEAFRTSRFQISSNSDRMGYRLKGPALSLTRLTELVSASVNFGTVQLLPDGQLIVLMADHQTSGGYPRLANVASADLPILAQLGPGDTFRFRPINVVEAEALVLAYEPEINWLKTGLRFGRYW